MGERSLCQRSEDTFVRDDSDDQTQNLIYFPFLFLNGLLLPPFDTNLWKIPLLSHSPPLLFLCSQARQWQNYASLELSHSNFSNVESIFTKSLRTTPSVDLWRFYLAYTRRINPLPPPGPPPSNKGTSGPDGRGGLKEGEDSEREKVRKILEGAYEFALRFIGNEKEAGMIWGEYIGLIKEREVS